MAERAVQAQEELLSVVTHDLNNPIAAMKGITQLLQRRIERGHPPDPAQLADVMTQLRQVVERMESFVRDLSTPQHMQPGQLLSTTPELVDLVGLARRVADAHQQRTERHQLRVEAGIPELVGYWDPARLEQVLDNLISNAVKYSPQGGVVRVVVGYEDESRSGPAGRGPGVGYSRGRAMLTVSDEGIGIPADDLPHVFEWYRRAANVRDIINGTGIGLAGARQIVEQLGGEITAESTEGIGSTFTVLLPLNNISQKES
jgi:signal transduction histidine kinase